MKGAEDHAFQGSWKPGKGQRLMLDLSDLDDSPIPKWLDMDEGVGDAEGGVAEGGANDAPDDVGRTDGGGAVDFDVDVHEVGRAAFTDAAFLHGQHAGDAGGELADLDRDRVRRGDVEHFPHSPH